MYEYFGELEYGSDSYWDARMKHLHDAKVGEKRKSEDQEDEARLVKKRRKDGSLDVRDNVLYVPFDKRIPPLPPKVRDDGTFALLPDWKERFPEKPGSGSPTGKEKEMPADMRRAAEAEDGEDEDEALDGEEEHMNMDDEEELEDEESAEGLDEGLVMQILRQKLADSGLGDVDESVFKDAISKMLSGEGGGEDALGGLTSLLLGQGGGGGEAIQGFLAGQGVQMDGEEEEDYDDNEDSAQAANSARKPASKALPNKRNPQKTSRGTTASPNSTSPASGAKTKSSQGPTTTATDPTTPNPTSPVVVPSPPPVSMKTSRKRRAPSLDEPSVPQPEFPSTSAKPAAKRRRTPRAGTPVEESEAAPSVATSAGRTTRSAAAAGKRGG